MSKFLPISILTGLVITGLIFAGQGDVFAASFALTFSLGALATWAITKFLIARFRGRDLTGIDMNKFDKPKIPEMGGIGVMFGFVFAIMAALAAYRVFNFELNITAVLAAFATVIIVAVIGILDDLVGWRKGIEQWQHALLPIFAALPLMVLPDTINQTILTLPFLGSINFGILYSLLIVPIAITGASNAVNMLAGFNGLEAGLGALITSTILLVGVLLPSDYPGKIETILLMAAMLGALLAFLHFNWFPAKIFGGDSLTLMIGASIAAVAIVGNLEKIALLLFAIYFVELLIKAKHRFRSECYGIPQKNGTLKPDPRGGSLTQWIMRRGSFRENQVVAIILGMQILLGLFVLFIFWFKLLNLVG